MNPRTVAAFIAYLLFTTWTHASDTLSSTGTLATFKGPHATFYPPMEPVRTLLLEATPLPPTGSGRWVFHTAKNGSVDLDLLLDRIDSVLDGKRRDVPKAY